ncbi:MAG: hypothetical protein SV375_05980 [Thermodesulfobacteriota bacterium]|nr:hypothetical protein [Thermodesulfobacteriota bacterium]
MKRNIFLLLFMIIPCCLWIQGAGCGPTKSVYKSVSTKVTWKSAGLRKKVLVLPVVDQAHIGEGRSAELTASLIELIKRDKNLLVFKASQPIPSTIKIRSPRFGIAIDPDLAKKAEELGMNVLITCVLNPFDVTTKRVGIWPFRKMKRKMHISFLVNAIDLINGTLFLTELKTVTLKMPDIDPEEQKVDEKISDERLKKTLSGILDDQASAIISGLRDQPWRGRVLSADNKTIIINAGKDIGLKPDSVFEVFGRGESILSASGRSINLIGPKVGEIKTIRVMESYSSAAPLTGGGFRAGQVIKMKD